MSRRVACSEAVRLSCPPCSNIRWDQKIPLQKAFLHQRFHGNISSSDNLHQTLQIALKRLRLSKSKILSIKFKYQTQSYLYIIFRHYVFGLRKNRQIRPITPVWDNTSFVFSPLCGRIKTYSFACWFVPVVDFQNVTLIKLEKNMIFWKDPYLLNGSVERYEKSFISCLISLSANRAGEKGKTLHLLVCLKN